MEEKCMWCGRTYEQHETQRAVDAAVPKVPCLLLKSGFVKSTKKEVSPVSPVTKTIMESMEDDLIETLVWYIRQSDSKHEAFEYIKSHLLQSQIRLIEAEIESLNQSFEKNAHLSVWAIGYNRALCDQISSLNETLEELKKSL